MRPLGQLYDALSNLARFIRSLPFWRMTPHPELASTKFCLAELGRTYAVYAPQGGRVYLDLTKIEGKFKARWFNPRTGEWVDGGFISAGSVEEFTAPDGNDWVLLVQR